MTDVNSEQAGKCTVFITLGNDNDFAISDQGMSIRANSGFYYESDTTIDLGPATKENFYRLISNMKRLECHLEE